jgi:hypothetical protein
MEVHQLFMDFKKVLDSVRKEVLYNAVIQFEVPMKIVRLIKMCLNEIYNKVCIDKHLFGSFPIQNGLRQGGALSPLLINFALNSAIRKVQEMQVDLKRSGIHMDNIDTVQKNTAILTDARKEVGLEVNAEKTKYMLVFSEQNAG